MKTLQYVTVGEVGLAVVAKKRTIYLGDDAFRSDRNFVSHCLDLFSSVEIEIHKVQ